jgi:hypothetical protein
MPLSTTRYNRNIVDSGIKYHQTNKHHKTECHDITEILLIVALNTIKQTNIIQSIAITFHLSESSTIFLLYRGIQFYDVCLFDGI